MRRDDRNEGIVMPLGQADHNQHQDRQQNEEFERGGELPYHLNAAYVDVSDHRDDRQGDDVVPPSRDLRKVVAQVVGKLHCVNAAQQERRAPVPPSGKKAPEIAKAGAYPAIKSALDRHGRSQLGRHQRDRDAPEKRNHQQEGQGHAGTGGGDHVFESEGAAGAVGEHYPDEIEQAGFAQGGLRGGGHGLGLYEADDRLQTSDCRLQIGGPGQRVEAGSAEGRMPSGQPAGRRRY